VLAEAKSTLGWSLTRVSMVLQVNLILHFAAVSRTYSKHLSNSPVSDMPLHFAFFPELSESKATVAWQIG